MAKQFVADIVKSELKITDTAIKSSHFYDTKSGDMEFNNDFDLMSYFSETATANIFVSRLLLGEFLNDVMIIISFNIDGYGDITLHFSEHELIHRQRDFLKSTLQKIVDELICIRKKYGIKCIDLGYESVLDSENVLLSITDNGCHVRNQFEGKLSVAVKQAFS